jgi:acyl transferase domain-containing protein
LKDRYRALLERSDDAEAQRLCRAAATRRSRLEVRCCAVGATRGELLRSLERAGSSRVRRLPSLVFLFPGQETRGLELSPELLRTVPSFRSTIEACEQAARPWLDETLAGAMCRGELAESPLTRDVCLFAFQLALARTWQSFGVAPAAVAGVDLGEFAAAVVAEAISLEEGVALVCLRSSCLQPVRGKGGLLAVAASAGTALGVARDVDGIELAAIDGRRRCVLGGAPAGLNLAARRLRADGIEARRLPFDCAPHTAQMEEVLEAYRDAIAGLNPRPCRLPFHSPSTVDGTPPAALDPDFWCRQLRGPRRLDLLLARAFADEAWRFLVLGEHPGLGQALADAAGEGRLLGSFEAGRSGREALAPTLGRLFEAGSAIDWESVSGEPTPWQELPRSPWLRRRCWPCAVDAASSDPSHARRAHDPYAGTLAQQVRRTVAAVLEQAESELTEASDLRALGIDSLGGLEISRRIRRELGVELPLEVFFEVETLGDLCLLVEARSRAAEAATRT